MAETTILLMLKNTRKGQQIQSETNKILIREQAHLLFRFFGGASKGLTIIIKKIVVFTNRER